MRIVISAALASLLILLALPERSTPPPEQPAPTPTPGLFATTVRPVLVNHCAPCHEPGGKMYDRLPFNDPEVVAAHAPGVLKRLKGEDREAVERWLRSRAP